MKETDLSEVDRATDKAVIAVPQPNAWATVAAGAIVPLGMAAAATLATQHARSERVAMAAWIAVAVVGTASIIASTSVARTRAKQTHHIRSDD